MYKEIEVKGKSYIVLACDYCQSWQRVVNNEQGKAILHESRWIVDIRNNKHSCGMCRKSKLLK